MKGKWIFRGIGWGLLFIAGIFVFAWAIMSLWNMLIPAIFHGPLLTYWQAFGLMILARLLLGWRGHWGSRCGGHWGRRHYWQHKMEEKLSHMSPEQKEKFMAQMRNRCGWGYYHSPAAETPATE